MPEPIQFVAVFAPVGDAVKFHQEGGARLRLDVSEQYKGAALLLAGEWLDKRLEVTIKEAEV